jgi:RNA polymerase sigma-70 factor (ECF subfamily)
MTDIASRDKSKVQDLYQDLRCSLLALLRRLTGDPAIAEDLLHEVMIKALAEIERDGRTPANLVGWPYAVARNAAMDYHRRQRPLDDLSDKLAAPLDDEDQTLRQSPAACLRPMTERLPPLYRDTVLATEFDGLTLAHLASEGRVSISAVKSRAMRGRRLLAEELRRCCRVVRGDDGQIEQLDTRALQACQPTTPGNRRQ